MEAKHANLMSVLLPQANNAEFKALVDAAAGMEPAVNGLWMSIMNVYFAEKLKTLQYTLNPELRTKYKKGGISDLALVKHSYDNEAKQATAAWQIIIEGKREGGDSDNFEKTLEQLVGYANGVLKTNGQWCYLIAAKGEHCMFWKYIRGSLYAVQPMKVENRVVTINGNIATQIMLTLSTPYSLKSDQESIMIMLQHIRTYEPGV
ncbi:hypothetical protein H0H92_015974 [Tricholoma furcatifolium]|nr:hypothetical protein H0H92_015974 [Tricholoma furcatifolium]